jgi:hypothetical protein
MFEKIPPFWDASWQGASRRTSITHNLQHFAAAAGLEGG